jgi:hypothetical protein
MNLGATNTQSYFPSVIYTFRMLTMLLTLLLACGCQSNSYRKSDATGKSLQKAAMEIEAEARAIDTTVASLNQLVNEPAADLKPQFHRFSTALDRLSSAADRAEKTQRSVEDRGAQYFAAWDQRLAVINYGIIREQSEQRFSEVTNRFYSINSRYEEAQGVVRPLIKYFTDIRTALSVDLTTAGLNSVRSIAANAEQNSRKVQTELNRLTEELISSSASMASRAQAKTNLISEGRTPVRTEATSEISPRARE